MKKLNKKQRLIILISVITVIVIIGIVVGANVIKTNIANGEYNSSNSDSNDGNLLSKYIKKGITLGGVTGTLESLNTFDATATAEDIAYGKTAYVKGEKITGTYRTLKDLEIGDYVAYKPDQASNYSLSSSASGYTTNQTVPQENLNWRVLSINDDGTVDLISYMPTSTSIYFESAKGYNNGVYILNDIAAKQYSNSSLGVTARSLTIEDIEAGMNESGLDNAYTYTSPDSGILLGQTKTYTDSRLIYYPKLYAQENGSGIDLSLTNDPNSIVKTDGIKQSDSYYSEPDTDDPAYTVANSSLTVKQTYYNEIMYSNYYKNSMFYNLIHLENAYWLASRYVHTASDRVSFGIRVVNSSSLEGYFLFNSSTIPYSNNYCLRPLVSLNATLKIDHDDGKTPETACQLLY